MANFSVMAQLSFSGYFFQNEPRYSSTEAISASKRGSSTVNASACPDLPVCSIAAHSPPSASAPIERAEDLSLCACAPACPACPLLQAVFNSAALFAALRRKSCRNSRITAGSSPTSALSTFTSTGTDAQGGRDLCDFAVSEGSASALQPDTVLTGACSIAGSHFSSMACRSASRTGLLR